MNRATAILYHCVKLSHVVILQICSLENAATQIKLYYVQLYAVCSTSLQLGVGGDEEQANSPR